MGKHIDAKFFLTKTRLKNLSVLAAGQHYFEYHCTALAQHLIKLRGSRLGGIATSRAVRTDPATKNLPKKADLLFAANKCQVSALRA